MARKPKELQPLPKKDEQELRNLSQLEVIELVSEVEAALDETLELHYQTKKGLDGSYEVVFQYPNEKKQDFFDGDLEAIKADIITRYRDPEVNPDGWREVTVSFLRFRSNKVIVANGGFQILIKLIP